MQSDAQERAQRGLLTDADREHLLRVLASQQVARLQPQANGFVRMIVSGFRLLLPRGG